MTNATLRRLGRREFIKFGAVGAAAAAITPTPARAQQPKRGGVLKHIGLEPPSFDIHGTVSYQTQLVSAFVRRTLFKFVNGAKHGPSDF